MNQSINQNERERDRYEYDLLHKNKKNSATTTLTTNPNSPIILPLGTISLVPASFSSSAISCPNINNLTESLGSFCFQIGSSSLYISRVNDKNNKCTSSSQILPGQISFIVCINSSFSSSLDVVYRSVSVSVSPLL
mmetsp:Transcript_49092/g.49875  ORF Transcript_49092/g.49875 Transcript_49092/m.49875 type:complete len:136 (-) Transcript_49092:426-833(-)